MELLEWSAIRVAEIRERELEVRDKEKKIFWREGREEENENNNNNNN